MNLIETGIEKGLVRFDEELNFTPINLSIILSIFAVYAKPSNYT